MKKLKIAHIDDNEAILLLCREMLKNHDVISYQTYSQYLRSFTIHDLLIIDLKMPDYTREIFEATVCKEDIPTFIFTGIEINMLGKDTIRDTKNIGVHKYFQKGIDDNNLVNSVNSYALEKEIL